MANVNGFNPLSPIEMPSALQGKGTEGGLLVFAGLFVWKMLPMGFIVRCRFVCGNSAI